MLHTIDISAKEWFDKANGNSYHSVQITTNFGKPDEQTFYAPFQYGYGEAYMQTATKVLQQHKLIPNNGHLVLWRYCEANNIILRNNITRGCKKRDVVAWGKG